MCSVCRCCVCVFYVGYGVCRYVVCWLCSSDVSVLIDGSVCGVSLGRLFFMLFFLVGFG